jgi:pyroglutamyl-peptidase
MQRTTSRRFSWISRGATWLLLVIAMGALGLEAAEDADALPAAAEPVILLTAFGPFAGRGVNGSESVAKHLDGELISGYRVHALVMPVVWGQPGHDLPPALQRLHPRLVIGLGEGYPGKVTVESIGRNRAGGELDAGNQHAPSPLLEPQGPPQRTATLLFDSSWFPMPRIPVARSSDAGDYLCNACLYTALGATTARCGFVHLPPQGDTPDADYAQPLLGILRTLIEKNLHSLP